MPTTIRVTQREGRVRSILKSQRRVKTVLHVVTLCAAHDGIMIALNRIYGWRLAPVRLVMEATVLALGWVLGGAVGVEPS